MVHLFSVSREYRFMCAHASVRVIDLRVCYEIVDIHSDKFLCGRAKLLSYMDLALG